MYVYFVPRHKTLDMTEGSCHEGQGVETAPHRGQQLAVLGPGVEVVQVPAAGRTLDIPET